jgi:outer membrane cobalamin receptor
VGSVVLAIAASALATAPAGAQERQAPARATEDTLPVYPLDPVVVTTTHLETQRSRVPHSVAVVTREQIRESGAASVLAVVNERVPGLFVTQRGVLGYGVAQGAAGRISIRGAGASPTTQVLVMTDGRPQTMGLMGHPIADTHTSAGVERVEVVRGPASVLYGTSAMGGVVNIISRRQWAPGFSAEAGAAYGSYGTQRLEGTVEYGIGPSGGIALSSSRYRTDGHRPFASFEIDNVAGRGGTQLRPGLVLLADGAVSELQTFDPGPVGAPREDNWVDIRRGTTGVSLENRGDRMSGAARVFFNFGRHRIHDGFRSRDHTLGLQLHQGVRLGAGRTLTAGADFKRFGGEADNPQREIDWGRNQVDETGVFALLQQPVVGGVVATGGVRMNHHGAYGTEWAPQLGLALPVAGTTTLRASSARGFRSPTIRELYLFPAPNPELRPERAWSHELGLLHRFGTAASLEVAAYRMEGEDLIRVLGSFPNQELVNAGRFVHRGGEVTLWSAPLPSVELDLSYGYLDPGELTQAHPQHQLHGSIRHTAGRVSTAVGVQHVAGLFAADGGQNRLPDYTVLGARAAIRLPGRSMVYLAGENLLDEAYTVMPGHPMSGRTVTAGVRVRNR